MKPTLLTDAAPPREEGSTIVFLAGAIKYWWLAECKICGRLEEPEIFDRENSKRVHMHQHEYTVIWDSPSHKRYLAWRDLVRRTLIDAGFLTYAPHEAFKGRWDERAQAVNDACIAASDIMLNLSPRGIPTIGTDDEIKYARKVRTPVIEIPPFSCSMEDLVRQLHDPLVPCS